MGFCEKCGIQLKDMLHFCLVCGIMNFQTLRLQSIGNQEDGKA